MPYTPNNPLVPGDPYSYDLKWIVTKIKEFASQFDKIDELEAFVMDYFENLDISAELTDILNQMYQDGTLQSIINDAFNIYNYQSKAVIARRGRLLDRFGDNNMPQTLYGQACCIANGLYYVCGSNSGDTAQTITVWNSAGLMVNSASYSSLDHANDICYCDGKLYIATGSQCVVIDPNSLAIVDTIAPGANLTSLRAICADTTSVYFVGQVSGYLFGINKYDTTTGTVTPLYDNISYLANTPQGCEYYDNAIYALFNEPNSVVKVNLNTGIKDYIYMLPDNDGFYWSGEYEGLFVHNDTMELFTRVIYPEAGYNTSEIAQIFASNIISQMEMINYNSAYLGTSPTVITVDSTATYEFNPRLTVQTVEEAALIVPDIEIRLNSNVQRGYYAAPRKTHITLICTSGNATISRVRCWGGSAYISAVNMASLYLEGVDAYLYKCSITAVTARYSMCKTTDCTMVYSNIQYSKVEIFDNSKLNSTGSSISSTSAYVIAEVLNPNLNNAKASYTALQTLLAGKGTSYAVVYVDVLSGGVGYHFNGSLQVSSLVGGTSIILKDINNNTLTWNGTTFTLVDSNNVSKTINQISMLKVVD